MKKSPGPALLSLALLWGCATGGGTLEPEAEIPPPGDRSPASLTEEAGDLAEAVRKAASALAGELPEGSALAALAVSAPDRAEGDFALESLILSLVALRKFTVLDRGNLDLIRAEQNLQVSGDVDDDTAVALGRLIGARIVITGSLSGAGPAYLWLRALEVESGRILAAVSCRF